MHMYKESNTHTFVCNFFACMHAFLHRYAKCVRASGMREDLMSDGIKLTAALLFLQHTVMLTLTGYC